MGEAEAEGVDEWEEEAGGVQEVLGDGKSAGDGDKLRSIGVIGADEERTLVMEVRDTT